MQSTAMQAILVRRSPRAPWHAVARWLSATIVIVAAACNKQDAPTRVGVNSVDSTGLSTASTGEMAKAPAPKLTPDIDVSSLQKKLRCGGSAHREVCRVLDEFASGRKWQLRIPSGQGRWAGNSFTIAAGKDKADVLIMSAREVPTNSIAPGDLPFRIGTGTIPDTMRAAGSKLVGALVRDDIPARGNAALAYLGTWTSSQEYSVVPTMGDSVRLVAEHETYIRQGKGQKIVIIQPHVNPSDPSAADGMYVELWPTNW